MTIKTIYITQRQRPTRKSVWLPRVPKTLSPVPHLTSIYATAARGPYGDASYRGNCSGYLIKDLLRYFQPTMVLDPMTGSGTCRDVCRHLRIRHESFDLKQGVDACDSASFQDLPPSDFVWLHPPYWRMIRYSDDPRCLSSAPSLSAFQDRLRLLIANCLSVLTERGILAVLMGDYFDPVERRYMPLTYYTKQICLDAGLWPACTDIIRFLHGSRSSHKSYSTSFIPGLHDTCLVMRRALATVNQP